MRRPAALRFAFSMISEARRSARAAEQDRPDVAAARTAWADNQPKLDPDRLVFIDETGTSTKMARLRGRAPRGKRLVGKIPHGHWKTTTFVAGLRSTALTTPCVIDGPMNGNAFLAYVEQVLAPTLKQGDVVVLEPDSAQPLRDARMIADDGCRHATIVARSQHSTKI
jgi:DDE superfamily endonuclease